MLPFLLLVEFFSTLIFEILEKATEFFFATQPLRIDDIASLCKGVFYFLAKFYSLLDGRNARVFGLFSLL